MTKIKLIVLATDFADDSHRMIELATQLASTHGARLHLLHVITELGNRNRQGIPASVMEAFVKEVTAQAVSDMHDFRQRLFADFGGKLSTDVVMGPGADEILTQAEQLGADLIVMGSHGRHGVEKLLLGSTTERLIRKSRIPVLTVPE